VNQNRVKYGNYFQNLARASNAS